MSVIGFKRVPIPAANIIACFMPAKVTKKTHTDNNYRTSCNKRLSLEIALIEVAQIGTAEETSDEDAGRSPGKILQPVFQETGKQIRPVSHQPAQVSAQKTPAPSATVYGTKATPVENSSTNKPTTTQQ